MDQPKEFNDCILVKFLIDHFDNFSFLSKKDFSENGTGTSEYYIERIRNIFDEKQKDKNPKDELEKNAFRIIFSPLNKDAIDVLDFWERLIIDAIKYLKWHDVAEFAYKAGELRKPNEYESKKSAYDKISEGSLGVYHLKEYFQAFIEFERLLYGAEQFYRDHVYHILRVWLIGQFIIHNCITSDFPITINEDKENLASCGLEKSSKNRGTLYAGEEDAIWCLIALTHDLGYPLSKVENINESLKKMMHYFAKTGLEEFSFSFPQQNVFT